MDFLANVIKEKEYKEWLGENLIFIFSGTGSGKSTLALAHLSISYFKQGKSVLYLVPRIILKMQIEEKIRNIIDGYPDKSPEYNQLFNIWTYQQLENAILNNYDNTIPSFDLLICDECHYFITDSIFNSNTQISYNFIFNNSKLRNKNKVILALTATPNNLITYMKKDIFYETIEEKTDFSCTETVKSYSENIQLNDLEEEKISDLKQKQIGYEIEYIGTYEYNKEDEYNEKYEYDEEEKYFIKKYCRHYNIKEIFYSPAQIEEKNFYFNTDKFFVKVYKLPKNYNYIDIKYLINEDEIISIVKKGKEKSIIFVSSKNKGQDLEKTLKKMKVSVSYIDSENKNNEKKENVKRLQETKTFPEKVFITTSVLDVGVDFFDQKIKNVIIAHTEPVELLQMLGRVRVQDTEQRISLFIFQRSARYFQTLLREKIIKKIKCYEYLEERKYNRYNVDENKNFINGDNLDNVLFEKFKPNNDLPDGYEDFLYLSKDYNNRYTMNLNELAANYLRQLHTFYQDISDEMMRKDKNYFIKKQLEFLGHENNFSEKNFYCLECLQEEIESKLKKARNGILQNECKNMLSEFKPLVRTMNKNIVRSNENLSIKVFNKFCKEYDIPYCIAQREDDKIKKTIYYLLKSDDKIINQLKLTIQS